MEPKVIQVQEAVLRGFEGAMAALNKSVVEAIRAVEPEMETAPEFDRPDPIEHASSLAKTVEQNISLLRKVAERKHQEGEQAAALVEKLAKALDHQAKGHKPCAECKATGRLEKSECEECGGEGFVEKAA